MPCGKESSPRIAIGRKLLTEDPSCEAVDMTALETFTTASKQPLTTGHRPDMTAICAFRPYATASFAQLKSRDRGRGGSGRVEARSWRTISVAPVEATRPRAALLVPFRQVRLGSSGSTLGGCAPKIWTSGVTALGLVIRDGRGPTVSVDSDHVGADDPVGRCDRPN